MEEIYDKKCLKQYFITFVRIKNFLTRNNSIQKCTHPPFMVFLVVSVGVFFFSVVQKRNQEVFFCHFSMILCSVSEQ